MSLYRPDWDTCALDGCDEKFEKTVHNKKYCSTRHMTAAHRNRNRDQINERWRRSYRKDGYAKHIHRTYGLSHEEYLALAEDGCEICGTSEGRLVVDHDHRTGKVRGVLCVAHNAGIGSFHDSVEEMLRGIAYLERHRDAAV